LEYEEILSERANSIVANNIIGSFLQASNSIFVNNYFHWDLITIDADDNKFTDAYVSGNADYLITHDSHFNVLKRKKFPKVNVITADNFLVILNEL